MIRGGAVALKAVGLTSSETLDVWRGASRLEDVGEQCRRAGKVGLKTDMSQSTALLLPMYRARLTGHPTEDSD